MSQLTNAPTMPYPSDPNAVPQPVQQVTGNMQPVQPMQPMPNPAQVPPAVPPEQSKSSAMGGKAKSWFARYTSLIILTISLGLAFGACVLAYQEYGRIAELEAQKQSKSGELDKYTSYASYLTELSKLKDQLDKNIGLSEQAIAVNFEIPQLMNQILKMAFDNGMEVETLNYSGSTTESTGTKTPGTISVQFNAKGNYTKITNLLSTFENARRLVSIKSLKYTSLVRSPDGTGGIAALVDADKFVPNAKMNESDYDLTITVSGYYLGEIKTPSDNIDALDPEILSKKEDFTNVVRKLESMNWYDPSVLNVQIGTTNPFQKLNTNGIQDLTNPISIPTTPIAPLSTAPGL